MSDLLIRLNDYPDTVTVEYCLECFQMALECTPQVRHLDTEIVTTQDGFLGFRDAETQALWLGFVMGMRCYERMIRQPKTQKPITEGVAEPHPLTDKVKAALAKGPCTAHTVAVIIKRSGHAMPNVSTVKDALCQMAGAGSVKTDGVSHGMTIWKLAEPRLNPEGLATRLAHA